MNQQLLYNVAKSFIGTDASPRDFAPDDVGCAESLSQVIRKAFPNLYFPVLLSTKDLYQRFLTSSSFQEVNIPQAGCIIINVTGTGNGTIQGHTGVVGKNLSVDGTVYIMSNNSYTGEWDTAYTLRSWKKRYCDKGGMKTHFFIVV